MSEERVVERPRRGARGITGAIILIALGIAFLLNNLGIVDFNWFYLLRFWPVILVLTGLDLLLGRSVAGSILVAIVGLVLVGGIFYLASSRDVLPLSLSGRASTREVVQYEMGDIESLTVEINLGAGEARIDALPDSPYVVDGEYTTDENLALETSYRVEGNTGYLTLRQTEEDLVIPLGDSFIGRLDIGLTSAVPINLIVNTGASALTLDLTGIQLSSLTVNGGVGQVELILPEEGDFDAIVKGGIGNFKLTVPRSLPARIEVEAGISNVDVPPWFDPLGDNEWTTPEFDAESNSALIRIETGIGNIDIR